MSVKFFPILLLVTFVTVFCQAQSAQEKVRQYRQANETALMDEYRQFLSIPNVSADSVNIRKNAAFILQMMKQRGTTRPAARWPHTGHNPGSIWGG